MHSTPLEIGERIKNARKEAGLSKTEIAERIKKNMRTVQKYESGEIEPSISMINLLADELHVSPAYLVGYERPQIEMNSLSDVFAVLYQLNKKADLRFEIDVRRPPHYEGWNCSIRFNGHNHEAKYNADLCQMLEDFEYERLRAETYFTSQDYFDHWFETELAYYAKTELPDKPDEKIGFEERIRRRDDYVRRTMGNNTNGTSGHK